VFAPADVNPQSGSCIPKAISRDAVLKARRMWKRLATEIRGNRAVGGSRGVDRQTFDQLDDFEALPG